MAVPKKVTIIGALLASLINTVAVRADGQVSYFNFLHQNMSLYNPAISSSSSFLSIAPKNNRKITSRTSSRSRQSRTVENKSYQRIAVLGQSFLVDAAGMEDTKAALLYQKSNSKGLSYGAELLYRSFSIIDQLDMFTNLSYGVGFSQKNGLNFGLKMGVSNNRRTFSDLSLGNNTTDASLPLDQNSTEANVGLGVALKLSRLTLAASLPRFLSDDNGQTVLHLLIDRTPDKPWRFGSTLFVQKDTETAYALELSILLLKNFMLGVTYRESVLGLLANLKLSDQLNVGISAQLYFDITNAYELEGMFEQGLNE